MPSAVRGGQIPPLPVRQRPTAQASRVFIQEIAMFGWLATRSTPLCHHAPRTVVSRRARLMTPQALISTLPGLGSVLYLHASTDIVMQQDLPAGLLVTQRAFAPLLHTRWLMATSVVTDDGPREWLECVDRFGHPRARLHLLPDTDYLAWDALMSSCDADNHPPQLACTTPLRPDSAAVVNFQLRKLAGLLLLEQGGPVSLSPLSDRIAARIAHAESALWVK
jgi:hypothetical protein